MFLNKIIRTLPKIGPILNPKNNHGDGKNMLGMRGPDFGPNR